MGTLHAFLADSPEKSWKGNSRKKERISTSDSGPFVPEVRLGGSVGGVRLQVDPDSIDLYLGYHGFDTWPLQTVFELSPRTLKPRVVREVSTNGQLEEERNILCIASLSGVDSRFKWSRLEPNPEANG